MNILLIFVVFLQAVLFKFLQLNSRKLQEKGLSPRSLIGLQKYAIVPAFFLFITSFKLKFVLAIAHNRLMIFSIVGIMLFWIIGEYVGYFVINSTNSLSLLNALSSVINLPLLLIMGILINKDIPNLFSILAIFVLIVALILKPTKHAENKRNTFKYQAWIVVGIIIINMMAHNLDGSLYRNMLNFLSPAIIFGTSLYILINTIMLTLLSSIKKSSADEKAIIFSNKWLAFSIPAIWFIASIPEGYSYAHIPIFTLVSISSVSFLIDIFSDLKNKRVILNNYTSAFIGLVLISIILSSISLWK